MRNAQIVMAALALLISLHAQYPQLRSRFVLLRIRLHTPASAWPLFDDTPLVLELLATLERHSGRSPVAMLFPRTPGPGDELAYVMYRCLTRTYPRIINFIVPTPAGLMIVDWDYRKTVPGPAHADVLPFLADTALFFDFARLPSPPPGFTRLPGASGFALYERRNAR
jgi:hypothetical protein